MNAARSSIGSSTRVAGLAVIVFALAGAAWLGFEATPVGLGFEDTDDPALMLGFVRAHPDVYVHAGMALLVMALSLTVAVLAVADVAFPQGSSLASLVLRSASAFGLLAAALFLVHAGIRIGSSGPLLHMGSLKEEWGHAAYVAAQVAGQALSIGAIVGVCLWAVGLSLIGLRTKVFPLALCVLGAVPAIRLVTGALGPLGVLPDIDVLWIVSMAAIPGTMIWFLLLGLVLLRRGFALADESRREPVAAA